MRNLIVRITKTHGKDNSTIPVGFWVEGIIASLPVVKLDGKVVYVSPVFRTSRKDHWDFFRTTEVLSVNPHTFSQYHSGSFTTRNSTYEYRVLPKEK